MMLAALLTAPLLASCSPVPAPAAVNPVSSSVAAPTLAPVAPKAAPPACLVTAPTGLPWATVFNATPAAPVDPGTTYEGQTATPIQGGVVVFSGPTSCARPVAYLPLQTLDAPTVLPVIGKKPGWVNVLLPSRRNLPSAGKGASSVNHPSGWIQAAAVDLAAAPLSVAVDAGARTVTLLESGKSVYRAGIEMIGGQDTAKGRTFVVGVYKTAASEQCSGQPMIVTAHQSESEDEYVKGDGAAVQALHSFSWGCKLSLLTGVTPGCTIISDTAVAELLARGVGPGTVVTVK
jgi:hypothetical protein